MVRPGSLPFRTDYLFLLLVCAALLAVLAQDVPGTILVALTACANLFFSRFVLRLRALQPKASHQVRQLYREVAVHAARRIFFCWVVLLLVALASGLSARAMFLFAAATVVALVPAGLPGLIAWLQETGPRTDGPAAIRPIARAIVGSLTPAWSALCLVACSLVGAVAFHAPLGISLPELIVLDALVVAPALAALRFDRPEPDAPKVRYRAHQPLLSRRNLLGLPWAALFAGALAYTNFVLFFPRRGLSPEYVAYGSHIHEQATALAFATLALCALGDLLQRRSSDGLLTRYQLHNRRLWPAVGIMVFATLCIIYIPGVSSLFQTAPLSPVDWLFAFAAALLFTLLRTLEHHTRTHSRTQLIARHGHEKIKKHLKLI
jgi:magnesium-transporting ATPase (P-type)